MVRSGGRRYFCMGRSCCSSRHCLIHRSSTTRASGNRSRNLSSSALSSPTSPEEKNRSTPKLGFSNIIPSSPFHLLCIPRSLLSKKQALFPENIKDLSNDLQKGLKKKFKEVVKKISTSNKNSQQLFLFNQNS